MTSVTSQLIPLQFKFESEATFEDNNFSSFFSEIFSPEETKETKETDEDKQEINQAFKRMILSCEILFKSHYALNKVTKYTEKNIDTFLVHVFGKKNGSILSNEEQLLHIYKSGIKPSNFEKFKNEKVIQVLRDKLLNKPDSNVCTV